MNWIELLAHAVKNNASDLHLSAGLPPIIRIDGELHYLEHPKCDHKMVLDFLYTTMSPAQCKEYDECLEVDYSLEVPHLARFRVNAFTHHRGAAGVFRIIPSKIKSLTELGMPPILKKLGNNTNGLILVTGTTGSGKSTTLAALIDHINQYGHH